MSLSFQERIAMFGAKKQTATNIPKNTPPKPTNVMTQDMPKNKPQNVSNINNVSKIENGNNQIKPINNTGNISNNTQPISNNAREMNKKGMLNNNKHPVIGSTFIEQNEKLKIYQYPKDVKFSQGDEAIVIIFVGQTGAGKSTFINAYLNYLVNITVDDNIRYKIIMENTSKNQTQSQTAEINIYNIRSIKYPNKLFQLIDTPGACDTNQKDEKFVQMYKEALDKVEKLNSITFVYNAGDVRETELQKKVVKNITNLFANNIHQNCLAALTHANNEKEHDAVQLLQKMEVFKAVKKSGDDWFFPVNSRCYFLSFNKGDMETLMTEGGFYLSQKSFKKYTEKVLKLKELMTNETLKNLKIKKEQKDIIEILEKNLLNVLFVRIKSLKDIEDKLQIKINEIKKKNDEILNIENEINREEENRKLIEKNITINEEKCNDIKKKLKENNDKMSQLQNEINSVNNQIDDCKKKQAAAEKEKKNVLSQKNDIDKKIKDLNDQIVKAKKELDSNVSDKAAEEERIKNLEESLNNKKKDLEEIEKDLRDKEKAKEELDSKKKELELSQTNITNQINSKKSEEEELKKQKKEEEEKKNDLIKESIESLETEKNNYIKSKIAIKNKYIQVLEEEKDKKLKKLIASKNELVEYPNIELIDDPNNERNLTCTKCKQICHENCDCLWGIPLFRPVVFCHIIKDGKCISCKCNKDVHNRKITKYITVMRRREKTKEEISEINRQIDSLKKEFNEKKTQYEKDFDKDISDYKRNFEYRKKATVKDIEIVNQTKTIIDINIKQTEIKSQEQNLTSINENLSSTKEELETKENEIKDQKEQHNAKNEEINNDEKKKKTLMKNLEKKEILIIGKKVSISQSEAKRDQIKTDYEKKQNSLTKTIETAKTDIKNKTDVLNQKQNALNELKSLNINNDLKSVETEVNKDKDTLLNKKTLIATKNTALERIRNDLTNTLMNEKKILEDEQNSKKDEAKKTKEEMFRKLCIIKILNKQMEEITLNKETISSLDDIIENLSKKFLDDRPLFLEIIKEFKDTVQQLDDPKKKPNPLYQKFEINEDDFKDKRLKPK